MMERSSLRALHSPLLLERVKQDPSWAPAVAIPLAETKQAKPSEMRQLHSQANLLVEEKLPRPAAAARQKLSQAKLKQKDSDFVSQLENHRLVLRLVAQLRARDLLLHSGKVQEMRHQLEQDSAVLRARARRYSRCPGPYAFYRETLVARKYNRGARCGGYPSPAQYPLPRTRRVLAGCGNKYTRSRRKHARPARTFLIAAADKYRFLPRRTAD